MLEKPKRMVDPKAIQHVREQAQNHEGYYVCEYCFRWWRSIEVHHIRPKGAGGDDSPENLIALCPMQAERSCHRLAQEYKISQQKLFEIARKRESKREGG